MLSIPPPSRIAIGYVSVAGQQVEVFMNPEWARYFESLNGQVSVVSGLPGLPGTPGTPGAAGAAVSFAGSESEQSVEFIPGPPGAQGPQGAPGPVIFLMQEPENNDVFWPIKNS